MTVNESIYQLTALTKQNLELLKAINDAFTSKSAHIVAKIGDTKYAIPSYLSLESKVDSLQANLENLTSSPSTGEAFMFFDGTTQKIELSGYNNSPNKTALTPALTNGKFSSSLPNIFKDFLTPTPYLRLNIGGIDNTVKNVVLKKVVLKNDTMLSVVKGLSTAQSDTNGALSTLAYSDLAKVMYLYTEDTDYIEYETTNRLPFRADNAYGEYSIAKIEKDDLDATDYDEYYTLTLNEALTYTIMDGTITKNIVVGDYLTTYNNKVKMQVTAIHPAARSITLHVLYGGYANLISSSDGGDTDMSKLRYFAESDQSAYDANKYIDVPLEEDPYVCIFVSSINDTTNTRSDWGTGVFVNVNNLQVEDPSNPTVMLPFQSYYKNYVNNIGDTLYDISKMISSSLSDITLAEMQSIAALKPTINVGASTEGGLVVTRINSHLDDSASLTAIRSLYNQKNQYKNELSAVEASIDNINKILADKNFDDTSTSKTIYSTQLADYNKKRAALTTSILSTMKEIAENASNQELPVDNGKYHIRGFIPVPPYHVSATDKDTRVVKVVVQYRYKNQNKVTGNAMSMGQSSIFSDWNVMETEKVVKEPSQTIHDLYEYPADNQNVNEPSFNQVDIPISQGETVDVKVKLVYDLGQPFVDVKSGWSDIVNIEFPSEYVQNVTILQIVQENNDEIQNNAFNQILTDKGINAHVEDKIDDQSATFFHKAENIASGFYTAERSVIPLKTQLDTMVSDITDLKNEVLGEQSDNLVITVSDKNHSKMLQPYLENEFTAPGYDEAISTSAITDPTFVGDTGTGRMFQSSSKASLAYDNININIYNNSEYNVKIYTMFPGDFNMRLSQINQGQFDPTDYVMPLVGLDDSDTSEDVQLTAYVSKQWGTQWSANNALIRKLTKINSNAKQVIINHDSRGVWMGMNGFVSPEQAADDIPDVDHEVNYEIQHLNQIMYFRVRDVFTGEYLYTPNDGTSTDDRVVAYSTSNIDPANGDQQPSTKGIITPELTPAPGKLPWTSYYTADANGYGVPTVSSSASKVCFATLFPFPGDLSKICINDNNRFKVLKPGESIDIPLAFYYYIATTSSNTEASTSYVKRRLEFDIRTSLYKDPTPYILDVKAFKSDTNNLRSITKDQVLVKGESLASQTRQVRNLSVSKISDSTSLKTILSRTK